MPPGSALLIVIPIALHIAAGIPPPLISRAMAEADAIWREAGVRLEWHAGGAPPSALRVEVGDRAGRTAGETLPLAWIVFSAGLPQDDIYVSRANAAALLNETIDIGKGGGLPPAAANEYLGRALGRALAHEIGHYLFRSPAHDERGVMATNRSTVQLFGTDRNRFLLTADERQRLAVVLEGNRLAKRAATPFD